MKENVASVHEGKRPFNCETCDYRCSKKCHLKKHVEIVHKGKKPFQCEFCDHTFSQKGHLKRHVASVHEGRKSFKCGICDYTATFFMVNSIDFFYVIFLTIVPLWFLLKKTINLTVSKSMKITNRYHESC